MLAYNDVETYTFVLHYRREILLRATLPVCPVDVLERAGVVAATRIRRGLDLKAFAKDGKFKNPMILKNGSREAFLESRLLTEFDRQVVEIQFGAMRFKPRGLFSRAQYDEVERNGLVAAIEKFASIEGFECGFSLHLGNKEDESDYRVWLADCVKNGRLCLSRLCAHEWLSIHALFVGEPIVARYGRELFLNCPAYQVNAIGDQSICLFFDNLNVSGSPSFEDLSFEREALDYLRRVLPKE